jgi:hypothetical protein
VNRLALGFCLLLSTTALARVTPDESRAAAGSEHAASADVRGAVKLRLKTQAADVQIQVGEVNRVTARVVEGDVGHVTLRPSADRMDVLFDDRPALRCGRVCVTVPPRSDVEVYTSSGQVAVMEVGGDVRVHTVAGDLTVVHANNVDVRSVSGDVVTQGVSGQARIETVSGDANVSAVTGAPRLQFSTAMGDLHWGGTCAAGCRLEARSLSGDLNLKVGRNSSFELHFISTEGEFDDDVNLRFLGPRAPREANLHARYGKGEGLIELKTVSGDVHIDAQP